MTSTEGGDKFMVGAGLGAEDIRVILKACKQSGVKSFSFGGLVVKFRGEGSVKAKVEKDVEQLELPLAEQMAELQVAEQAAMVQSEVELREEQLARALVEDPAEYEKLVIMGDVTDADTKGAQPVDEDETV